MDLELASETRGAWVVVSLRGEVDLATAPRLRHEVDRLLAEGRSRIVVCLADVPLVDSTGLGVLVGGLKRARERGGELVLACPPAQVLRLLSVTRLDEVFPVHETVADALGG